MMLVHNSLQWLHQWYLMNTKSGLIFSLLGDMIGTAAYMESKINYGRIMYCDQRSKYIRLNLKKNSFRGNYSRKYGMRLVEISMFSLNHVIVRPTKIMNKADKNGHIFGKQSTLEIKVFK